MRSGMSPEGGAVHTPGDLPASTSGDEHRYLQSRVCLRGHNQKVMGISGGRESRCSPPRSLQAEGARHPPNTSSRCRATASAMSSRQGRTAICRSITWTGTLVEQARLRGQARSRDRLRGQARSRSRSITRRISVDSHACGGPWRRINVDSHACGERVVDGQACVITCSCNNMDMHAYGGHRV